MISDELLEKYLFGEATTSEMAQVLLEAKVNPELAEKLFFLERLDSIKEEEESDLPMRSMAANSDENMCDIDCESFILGQKFPDYNDKTLLTRVKEQRAYEEGLSTPGRDEWINDAAQRFGDSDIHWLDEKGTALFNIGRIMEKYGLSTTRRFLCTLDDLKEALNRLEGIIVVVNEAILLGKDGTGIPDHAVCVLSISDNAILLHNPSTGNDEDEYPLGLFTAAWEASRRYAVLADTPERKIYDPHPRQLLENVTLNWDLTVLGEAIAEHAHDVWAEKRFSEGYVYGPVNNSDDSNGQQKTNMDLVPYSELPESEKDYDRDMSMETLKLITSLGYEIEPKSQYRCPQCGKRIKKNWNYCAHCSKPLGPEDFLNQQ